MDELKRHSIKPPILILVLLIAMGPFGDTEYIPSLSDIAAHLGVDYSSAQFTVTAYLLGYAFSQLIYGPLSDRFGRRPIMLIGACIFILGSVYCIFSHSLVHLIIGRFIQALGACAGAVISRSSVRDAFPVEEQSQVYAKVNAAFAIAPGIGPIIGVCVDNLWGWRANFLVLLILSVFMLLAIYFFLPETNQKLNKDILKPEQLRATLGVLLQDPYYLPYVSIMGLCMGIVYSCLTEAPILIAVAIEMSVVNLVIIGTGVIGGFILGSLLCRFLSRRIHANMIISCGLASISISSVVMGYFASISVLNFLTLLLPIACVFLGIALVFPICSASALLPFGSIAGSAAAVLGFFQMTIASFGTALISWVHDGTAMSMPITFSILSSVAIFVFFTFIVCRPNRARVEV